jgi:aminoglycoside phosphotransferase family enzyme/predicted kinase
MPDDQRAIVAFLEDPASHGGAAVERVTTHISELFLAGARVYKLKRAVVFPYLDFSTASRRRAACAAEVAVNRRTAPQLYLGVAPVVRDAAGRMALGALDATPDDALDWVVVMRRFDQAQLFDRLALRGALTPALVRELADQVVALHRLAAPEPGRDGAGPLRAILEQNLAELAEAPGAIPADLTARVAAASRAALDAVAGLLDRRAAAGRVRRCHGDLHLRNICLIDEHPTLFDAIEFNDAFAVIDVLYDLAFLVMDLLHRGLGALANQLLNRYLESLDELDGIPALGVLLAQRAIVRAKIDRDQSVAYLDLALACLAPGEPRLIALGGFSGTGKTTVARALAPAFGRPPGALILRSDVVRKQLAGVTPETRLAPSAYGRRQAAEIYDALRRRAELALGAGYAVVLDAVHARPDERAAAVALAQRCGVPFAGLWLQAPPAALTARVAARVGDASDATADVIRQQLAYDTGKLEWPVIETEAGLDATLAQARAALGLSID